MEFNETVLVGKEHVQGPESLEKRSFFSFLFAPFCQRGSRRRVLCVTFQPVVGDGQIAQMPHMVGCAFMLGMTQTSFNFTQCLVSLSQPPWLLSPFVSFFLLGPLEG